MVGVGSMYGLSALQIELPRLLGLSAACAVAPFGAASAGLAVGTGVAARILERYGAKVAGAAGAQLWGICMLLMGASVAASSLLGLLSAAAIGGVGVGVAYLAIVATVGPRFPTQPLIGSAIGPLGFATGTALFLLVAAATGFASAPASAVGVVLGGCGVVIVVFAVASLIGMPPADRPATLPMIAATGIAGTRRSLSLLLFLNALPGMLVFAIAVDLLVRSGDAMAATAAEALFAVVTVALFLGGVLAPLLRQVFGARVTLIALLLLRGIALVALPFLTGLTPAVLLLTVVLFGHGAGFSLLPPIVRAHDTPGRFAANYGRVLIAWGAAGVLAALLAAVSIALTFSYTLALCLAGVAAILGAAWLTPRARIPLLQS